MSHVQNGRGAICLALSAENALSLVSVGCPSSWLSGGIGGLLLEYV